MHGEDDDNVKETRIIISAVGNSETVQRVENSVMNENGVVNVLLEILDKMSIKGAGVALKVIKFVKIMVDDIAPRTNRSLQQEGNLNFKAPTQNYNLNYGKAGYLDSNNVWHAAQ